MMLLIPLEATPNQNRSVQLGTINYKFGVRAQDVDGVQQIFLTLREAGADTDIVTNTLCRDRVRIIRDAYLGFNGDLSFFDTQGTDDPFWQGFESRFVLAWFEPGEVVS